MSENPIVVPFLFLVWYNRELKTRINTEFMRVFAVKKRADSLDFSIEFSFFKKQKDRKEYHLHILHSLR